MPNTCYIVSHTHWDREWYRTYQQFRLRLVALLDKLLPILEADPSYAHFLLDGQTIVLDDYLELRPDQREALRRYVQAGRLLIGPWHILADEFLVSGEALVRNLLLGERKAREFGPKMETGYLPDAFGHIAQMPQILRGFGIQTAVLWRGLDDHPTELWWHSPDGSSVLLCYLRDSYSNAARLPLRDTAALAAELERLCDSLSAHSATDLVLLMNGTDHMEPSPDLPRALAAAQGLLPGLKLMHATLPMYIQAVQNALQLDLETATERGAHRLPVVQGELRSPKRQHLLPGVLSTRMWIKQRNHQVQLVLEKWSEPFLALAALSLDHGLEARSLQTPCAALGKAWEYLLQNHAHDSICGCGIDPTHRDMATRFDWAEQIGEELVQQSLLAIAERVDVPDARNRVATGGLPLVVFNPLGEARTDLVSAKMQLPGDFESFRVVGLDGHPTPHQVLRRTGEEFAKLELSRDEILQTLSMVEALAGLGLSLQELTVQTVGDVAIIDVTLTTGGRTPPELLPNAQRQVEAILAKGAVQTFRIRAHQAITVQFSFLAEDVPGCGFKTYFLLKDQLQEATQVAATRALHLESDSLAVDVSLEDGTLTLLDKATGQRFHGLHRFVDGGDRGDEYNFCPPEAEALIVAPASPPEIVWLEQGPLRWTIQVKQIYRVPVSFLEDRSGRSEKTVDMPITSQISLSQGVPRLEFRTEVNNPARDHRLRVHFPTSLHTDSSDAEGAFDVVRRPLGLPDGTDDWVEQPVPTQPQKAFVDVSDGQSGLMLANRGLPEYEVLREDDGSATVALTLLRCVGWLSRDDFRCRKGHAGPALETPEAQCPGRHVFEYALVPHAGGWQAVYGQAHAFAAPLRAVVPSSQLGSLPLVQSLIQLEGDGLVLSAVKVAEAQDGLIVRFYNITDRASTACLRTFVQARSASVVNLAEQKLRPLDVDRTGQVRVEVQGKQIFTVKLLF